MTKKIIEDRSLAMQHSLKLKLISYTNYKCLFFSFYEDVKTIIKELKTKYLIFMIEQRNYNLVLSQYFLNLIKFN